MRAVDFGYDAARLLVGAGWDLPLFGPWVAGNRITLDTAAFGRLENDGTPVARDVGLSMVRVGIYLRHR